MWETPCVSEFSVLFPADREDRDRAYSPSSCVPDIEPFLVAYADESARVREQVSLETVRYGSGPRAELDVFRAGTERVHCFIHGGYWQQLSKASASFPAEHFVAAGITYVAIGYDLCPDVGLDEIVDQTRTSVARVRAEFPDAELTVSGSSAGAHLAAMVAVTEVVDRIVLLSGIYDLRPLVETYVNDVVGLSERDAVALSPLLGDLPSVSATIVWGENETEAFKEQSRLFAAALGVAPQEIAGRNHFDIVHDLFAISEPSSGAR